MLRAAGLPTAERHLDARRAHAHARARRAVLRALADLLELPLDAPGLVALEQALAGRGLILASDADLFATGGRRLARYQRALVRARARLAPPAGAQPPVAPGP